ncbi:MAG: ATP-binding cassette domain-containing protein [Candidatus Aminicenantes bacterium]|nr:ATP-binding cassette domain-containing protein [Candidatus Aminicenantes bacterium]
MKIAIKVENLVKCYEKTVAVDHVSFAIPEGELFGLLGPNGAGKTTIINILATLIRPTSGYAEVAGISVAGDRDALRRRIGIVFQEPALDVKLTGRENLQFHAMMYSLSKPERKQRIAHVLELVDLLDKADLLVEKYSGGMKRRLEIARGLVQHPKVLFLDEPTLGLDSQTRRHIWDYIRKLNKEKRVTIILTTHYMDEADYLCDRVAIIDKGRIVAMDTPTHLKDVLGGDMVHLEISGGDEPLVDVLRNADWITAIKRHDGQLSLTMEQGDKRIPELMCAAMQTGTQVLSVNLRKPSLEDVFLHFTGSTIREEELVHESQFHFVHGRGRR